MKERPILFNDAMVRAILDGRKTQTRRVVKWPRLSDSDGGKRRIFSDREIDVADMNRLLSTRQRHPCARGFCPYGRPGDRLWVRETFCYVRDVRTNDPGGAALSHGAFFRADYGQAGLWHDDDPAGSVRWRPSIHMPRRVCRIVLEITGVRVERLNAISEADALEEGITYHDIPNNGLDPMRARTWFRGLWESINGPGSWDANPWVWVVEFRRLP